MNSEICLAGGITRRSIRVIARSSADKSVLPLPQARGEPRRTSAMRDGACSTCCCSCASRHGRLHHLSALRDRRKDRGGRVQPQSSLSGIYYVISLQMNLGEVSMSGYRQSDYQNPVRAAGSDNGGLAMVVPCIRFSDTSRRARSTRDDSVTHVRAGPQSGVPS